MYPSVERIPGVGLWLLCNEGRTVLNSVGKIIREARDAHGLPRARLAKMLWISVSYLYLIETDRRKPSALILARIAQQLELDVDLLFAQTGQLHPDTAAYLTRRKEARQLLRMLVDDDIDVAALIPLLQSRKSDCRGEQ